MTSILLLLSINEPRVKYMLQCKESSERWIMLLNWLSEYNIAMCTREEYENPDSLKARNMYCIKGESVDESFKLFQVLSTSDWQDKETPAPQFTSDIGFLAWTYITDSKCNVDPKQAIDAIPEEAKKAEEAKQQNILSALLS